MNKLVSVIIPSYNHEKFIQKALISVYNQTYKHIELIITDDNSNDNTFSIAEALINTSHFRKRFTKIVAVRNEANIGAHANINKGILLSSGEIISLLNSDDFYHPERLEKILSVYKENNGYFFAFSNYAFVNERGEEIPWHPLYIDLQLALQDAFYAYPTPWFIFLQRQIALSTGNFVFTKYLYNKVGGFLNLRYCHDLDFILQSLRFTEPVFINEPLYYYRIHSGNTYLSVKNLALAETEVVLTRYFKSVEYGEVINKNAPCRRNFPLYFENIINKFNLKDYFIRAIVGYSPVHRVIDKEIFKESLNI